LTAIEQGEQQTYLHPQGLLACPESQHMTTSNGMENDPRVALRIQLLGQFRVQVGSRVIQEAAWRLHKAADVPRFVYVSLSGQIDLDFPLRNAKRAVEQRLKDSGLVYTILRPTFFMEDWLSPSMGFDVANAKASIYGSGERAISWISLRDVARFAVASLEHPAARYATLELGGPELISPLQLVRIFEEAGGRPFEVQHVPEEALQAQQASSTDPMDQSLAGLMRCYARGDTIGMCDTLETFPLRLISVREYAQGLLH
jgi:uncharacterized protein YbjT (DUF2867 family)